jgi:diaminohydroxyphosphoribosylaminopyrimidine deaminase/5-amino-6-(5-phosphoribosylamino)uracil reductase
MMNPSSQDGSATAAPDASLLESVSLLESTAMHRAIALAKRGPANDANPQVGCIILDAHGEVIAEGWHRGSGTAHAEVDALSKLASPGLAVGGTAIVTLEPCNHTGQTGPCSEALIAAGVARVLYAVADPGQHSSGGASRLREAGVDAQGGLCAMEASESILPWLTAVRRGSPFVTVKWASSLDGRAAAADGTSRWITGAAARADVHRRRSEAGAILVGTGTVLTDDPSLTARTPDGTLYATQPVPVVIGHRTALRNAQVRAHPSGVLEFATHDLPTVLAELAARRIRHVFVEGGPTLASAFVAAGLVDEFVVYVAPTLIGGPRTALEELDVSSIGEQHRLRFVDVELLGDDLRIIARPINSHPIAPRSTETD